MDDRNEETLLNEIRFSALGPDRVLEFPFLDTWCKLYVPFAQTDLIQRTILKHRTFYEHYLLLKVKEHIMHGDVVADIGANIGNHSVFFGKVCAASRVLSFEPLRTAFRILTKNLELNGIGSDNAVNAAIGDCIGSMKLKRFTQTNMGGSEFSLDDSGTYRVITLDSLNLNRLDFIKIDVEGSQSGVIKGATQTIARLRPRIWAEIRVADGMDESFIFEQFTDIGYLPPTKLGATDYLFLPARG